MLHDWLLVLEPWQFAPELFELHARVWLCMPPPQLAEQLPKLPKPLQPQVVLPAVQLALSDAEPWQFALELFELHARVRVFEPLPHEFEHEP